MHVQKYLILLAQERLEFRIPELSSIMDIYGKTLHDLWDKSFLCPDEPTTCSRTGNSNRVAGSSRPKISRPYSEIDTPYIVLRGVDADGVEAIMSRSVLAKQAYEVWGHGVDYKALKASIEEYPQNLKLKYFDEHKSFCIRVKASGRKISIGSQIEKIESLENVLPFGGQVNLKNPSNEFHIVEDYGQHSGNEISNPRYIYFGRLIATGQRNLISNYSVKQRKFIGNTSMESGLSLIMSNMAKVTLGDYVCDPFVGTGSLLIAAAHFGGYVTGGDINYNILHSRGKSSRVGAGYRQKDETIYQSLCQYKLGDKFVDALVHDAANHPWNFTKRKSNGVFDAIITDPPYGIREGCRKIGTDKESLPDFSTFDVHHPQRTAYHLNQVYSDLLAFAASALVPGGRLVYWIPIYIPEYRDKDIPSHPQLKLIYNCEQPLKRETSRRLIVMEKLDIAYKETVIGTANMNMYQGHNAFRDKYFKISSGKS